MTTYTTTTYSDGRISIVKQVDIIDPFNNNHIVLNNFKEIDGKLIKVY